jgi:hypothetical protein
MGKTRKLADLVNVVVTDMQNNVTLPKALTIGEVPAIDDDSFKVPTTSWVNDKLGGSNIPAGGTTGQLLGKQSNANYDFAWLDPSSAAYVPYTGATTNVDLGSNSITANSVIKSGGTSSQFLKADGSVDSSIYSTTTGTVTSVAALTLGTSGTDLSSTVATGTTTPVITLNVPTASATNRGALSSTDWSTFNNKLSTISGITAGGELSGTYPNPTLVNSAVMGKLLTGVNITGGSIAATDSILTAFGKVQNQINSLVGGVNYQGTWNASTNLPALTSSVGTKGYYYVVTTAGTTSLNGINDWKLGDWVIFNGTTWDKVDNTDSVISVNGFTGAVSLTTDNISEGSANLYYTNARVRGAISLTTSGSSGAATYSSSTGVLNIPNYGSALSGYVTLDTTQTITGLKTFTSSGSANTVIVNHTSGSGHGIDITKAGSGEGLRINKTSGSGNAASITGGITLLSELNLTTKLADAHINSAATWNAKIGGSGTTNYLAKFTASGTVGNSLIYDNGTNVGIGTTSPARKLVVSGSGVPFGVTSDNNQYLILLEYSGGSSTSYIGTTSNGLIFAPSSASEAMRITSTGNVGIGTTSPSSGITSSETTLQIQNSNVAALTLNNSSSKKYTIYSGVGGQLGFYDVTGGAERMTISGGNVGIGTTSPAAKLDVNGGVNSTEYRLNNVPALLHTNVYTALRDPANSNILLLGDTNDPVNYYSNSQHIFRNRGGTSEYMRITSAGNVGIGTASPTALLQVLGATTLAANTRYLKTHIGGAGQWGANSFEELGLGYSGIRSIYSGIGENWDLAFSTGTSTTFNLGTQPERMRITSTGNVGIGTTSPSGKLHVVGGSTTTSISNAATTVNARFDVANPAVSLGIGYVSADIPMIQSFNNGTNAAANLTINPFGGNVGIGSTSPAEKLDVNGNVRVTGTMTATLGGFNSDINDKKDLIYGAKSNVLDLNAVSYLRKSTNNKEYGYIAQDVKKVLPEAVYETVSGLAVSYHMVNAAKIQALQEEIKELKAKLLSK